jgi:hypothetical protein
VFYVTMAFLLVNSVMIFSNRKLDTRPQAVRIKQSEE